MLVRSTNTSGVRPLNAMYGHEIAKLFLHAERQLIHKRLENRREYGPAEHPHEDGDLRSMYTNLHKRPFII